MSLKGITKLFKRSIARSVFITGASRGIGLELVKQIAETSPQVLIAGCRNPSAATDLQEIAKKNKCVTIVKLDVEKDDDINEAFKTTQSLVGADGLNLLINNAGVYLDKEDGGQIRVQTRERMQRHFNVNTTSPIIVTQKFLPLLELASSKKPKSPLSCSKAASVIMSSILASQNITSAPPSSNVSMTSMDYKCSKSAANMAAILMAKDLKDYGILVMSLHPGWVRTDMGGDRAPVTTTASAQGLLQVMAKATDKESGAFKTYDGKVLPF